MRNFKIRFSLLFLFLCGLTKTNYCQVNLDSGLVAYYPFNGNANDASGHNLNGNPLNGVQLTADKYGNPNSAYHFDGVDDFIQIPNSPSFNPTNALTIALYFNPEQNGNQTLIGKIDYTGGIGTQFQVAMDFPLYPGVLFGVNPPSNDCAGVPLNGAYVNTTNPVGLNQWYCAVATFDNGIQKIYLNGALIQTTTASFNSLNQCATAGIQIGSWWQGDPQRFKGTIDEVRIYGRAINQQEVNALCDLCNQPQGSLVGSSICSGKTGTLTFNSTVGTPPFSIQYTDGINIFTQNNVQPGVPFNVATNPSVTTSYIMKSLSDATTCARTIGFIQDTGTINVNPLPQAQLTGGDICVGQTGILLFTAGSGTPPYNIQYGDGTNKYTLSGLNSNTGITVPYQLTDTTNFTLITVNDANGCIDSANATTAINVNPLPQGSLSGSTSVCAGDSVNIIFTETAGTPPFEVVLFDGTNSTSFYGVQPGAAFQVGPVTNSTTITLMSLTDQDGSGCTRTTGFTSPTVDITVKASPQLQFGPLGSVCVDSSAFQITQASELSGLPGNGVFSGDGTDALGNFSAQAAGTGTHTITYTYTGNDGCIASDSSTITVNALPLVNAGNDIITCLGFPVQLNATGAANYVWSPANLLDDPTKANPIATTSTTTTFIVKGTDSNGCYAYDSVNVAVNANSVAAFQVPNAFTPNGDGLNDCFGIKRWGDVTIEQFVIYNRWGQLIFTTKDPSQCWDGTFKGKLQDAGGYPFIIKAKSPCGEITRKGILILVR